MAEPLILNAPVYEHGYVTGRYLTAVADGPDADRLMDFTPAKGKVIFTPENVIRRYEGPSPALVVQRPVECPINSQGYLTSPDGWNGVSLITGIYSVRFEVQGAQVPGPKRIQVKASHTQDAPLDLVLSMPEVVPPGSVVVVDETTAQRAEAAAARAEAVVADIESEVRAVVLASPELKGERGEPGEQGEPGAPGAVPTSSDYLIVGPGRPDQPTTTGGVIKGSEPVGAEYRSTDGAGGGLFDWMKRPTGWVNTGGGVDGSVPIFVTLAEAEAWEAANPGKKALTLEPSTPDTTAPYAAGTLTVTPAYTSAMLYVSGAQDDRAITGYAFSTDGGTSWSAWQTSPSYTASGLTGSTQYTFKHKVRDRAGNETAGVSVQASTTAAPAMTPAEVGSLWGHWDASVAESLTLSETSVTGWKDLTANARVASQATAAQRPVTSTINGKAAVKFDKAASQVLRHQSTFTIDATVGYTMVWVGRFDDADLTVSQAGASLAGGAAVARRTPDGFVSTLQNPTLTGPDTVKPTAGQVVMIAAAIKSNSPSFAWASGQAGRSSAAPAGNPGIALDFGRNAANGSGYGSMTMGEFWVHDKQLSTTELSSLHQYAQQKWGAA